jgi:IclR family acetate operon transcriptional repressor
MTGRSLLSKTESFQVPALERAIAILELLSINASGMKMKEIADKLALPLNSVFRITGSLEQRGYLLRNPDNLRFCLSSKLLTVGLSAIGDSALLEQSSDVIRKLRDVTGETTALGIRSDTHVVVVDRVPSFHALTFSRDPGSRLDIHATAGGKAFAAFMEPAELKALIKKLTFTRYTKRTLVTAKAFKTELEKIRDLGYATDTGERFEGVSCVSAPIFNFNGRVIAVIWTAGPSFRLSERNIVNTGKYVVEAAREISERLGHECNRLRR